MDDVEKGRIDPPAHPSNTTAPTTSFIPLAGEGNGLQQHSPQNVGSPPQSAADTRNSSHRVLYSLLVPQTLSAHEFDQACHRAAIDQLPLDVMLINLGLIDEGIYLNHLSKLSHVQVLGADAAHELILSYRHKKILSESGLKSYVILTHDGIALVPIGLGPEEIADEVLSLHGLEAIGLEASSLNASAPGHRVRLVSDNTVRRTFERRFRAELSNHARHSLATDTPEQSAKFGINIQQKFWLFCLTLLTMAGFYYWPETTALGLSVFFAFFFMFVIILRGLAAMMQLRLSAGLTTTRAPETARTLPVYTLLVPLYQEANMIPQLVRALSALDYPAALLDIKLLLEERDHETIAAVQQLSLPGCFETLIVPDEEPLTKPKALNYGLLFARGDFIVVYDAEDIPEPGQLHAALAHFNKFNFLNRGESLAVVQARLNFYNPKENWLARQFTIEYSSLFDGLLPLYYYIGFPIPLGGTSNHFRRDILEQVGGWDPYNVTEDADLGMRLYRRGFQAAILNSTTYEEACSGGMNWLRQRTRWMKGWLQTYCVHMRQPMQLLYQMGPWRFLGFQAVMGGPFFSALVHPIFMALLIHALIDLPAEKIRSDVPLLVLWAVAFVNLAAGYVVTLWLGVVSLRFRSITGFVIALITLPFYWLFISLAAYRAVFQFLYAPFKWEKTPHKGL